MLKKSERKGDGAVLREGPEECGGKFLKSYLLSFKDTVGLIYFVNKYLNQEFF